MDRHLLERAFQSVLGADSLTATFSGRVVEGSNPAREVRGVARWYRGGILTVDVEAPEEERDRILRIGDRAWRFDAAGGKWDSVAGRKEGTGFQDPFELLSTLHRALERAPEVRIHENEPIIVIDEPDGIALFGPLLRGEKFMTGTSHAMLDLDGGSSIQRVDLKAGYMAGYSVPYPIRCDARVEIIPSQTPPMKFGDIPAPFTEEMRAAVQKAGERSEKK